MSSIKWKSEKSDKNLKKGSKEINVPIKVRLRKVIENCNINRHRGIGMTPLEALKNENFEIVIENSRKYTNEFRELNLQKLRV